MKSKFASLQSRIMLVFILAVVVLWSGIGLLMNELFIQVPEFRDAHTESNNLIDHAVPLLVKTKEISKDVIEVQGWLTDISATRAAPGFADGFDEAERFAQKFYADVSSARADAEALGLSDISDALKTLNDAFGPFYGEGKIMAQAYIDGGPQAGNVQMNNFDAVAANLATASDALNVQVDARISSDIAAVTNALGEFQGDNAWMISTLTKLMILSAVVGILGLWFIVRMLHRNFKALNHDVEAVMTDDCTVDLLLGTERRDEFAQVGKALLAFRENIAANKLKEDELREAEKRAFEQQRQAEADEAKRLAKQEAEALATERREQERLRETERREAEAEKVRIAKREAEADVVRQREQKATQEISIVVAACAEGDFSQTLNTEDKDGVFAELCDGINRIGEVSNFGLAQIKVALDALSQGDLTHNMHGDFKGIFAEIRDAVNVTIQSLGTSFNQINQSSEMIRNSTREVAESADNMAKRTEHSAAT